MARFKSPELGFQLEPFCWSCDQPEPRHSAPVTPVGYGQLCGPGPRRAAGAVEGSNPPSPWIGNGTGADCVKLQCSSWSSKTATVRQRRRDAILAAAEKECRSACSISEGVVQCLRNRWSTNSPWICHGLGAGCVKQRCHRCGVGSCHVAAEVWLAPPLHSPWIGNGTGLAASSCSVAAAATGHVAAEVGVDVRPPSAPRLAELKALGVSGCRIHYFWQK